MQCKGRYTKEKNGLKFPTKGFYFTERRCGEIATNDELCKECIETNLANRHRKCPMCGEKFGHDDVKQVYFTH